MLVNFTLLRLLSCTGIAKLDKGPIVDEFSQLFSGLNFNLFMIPLEIKTHLPSTYFT